MRLIDTATLSRRRQLQMPVRQAAAIAIAFRLPLTFSHGCRQHFRQPAAAAC